MKKQAFPGHKLLTSRLQSMREYSNMVALRLRLVWEFRLPFVGVSDIGWFKWRNKLFQVISYSPADFKACESTVTWWPFGFGQSENFSCLSRCQWHSLIYVTKQAFLGYKLFSSRLQSMREYSYMVALRLWSVWEFQLPFLGVSDIGSFK